MSLFEARHVYRDFGSAQVLQDITFSISEGESFGIIGPNGSGKSTLLKAMTGLLQMNAGEILFRGKPVSSYKRKELARQLAVLEQEGTPAVAFTVDEVVTMGRYPWLRPFADLSAEDYAKIQDVLTTLDLWDKRMQPMNTLSGGERQLVSLARALVQEPQVLILDEPTTYLDIGNQMLVMQHVHRWHKAKGITVVMVLHDLNLAGQYCDRLLLLERGVRSQGSVSEVLKEKTISSVYKANLVLVNHPVLNVPQILLQSS